MKNSIIYICFFKTQKQCWYWVQIYLDKSINLSDSETSVYYSILCKDNLKILFKLHQNITIIISRIISSKTKQILKTIMNIHLYVLHFRKYQSLDIANI